MASTGPTTRLAPGASLADKLENIMRIRNMAAVLAADVRRMILWGCILSMLAFVLLCCMLGALTTAWKVYSWDNAPERAPVYAPLPPSEDV